MDARHSAKKPEKPSTQKAVERANWLARKEQGFAGLAGHGAGKHHTREWDAAKGRGKPKHRQDWSAERYAEEPTLTQPLMTRRDYGTGETKMATDLRSKLIRLAHANPELRPQLLPLLAKTADLKLTPKDKKAIMAFLDHKEAEGTNISSDGKQLDGNWMGGTGIAIWEGDKIDFPDLGGRSEQTVQRAIRKEAPASWLKSASTELRSNLIRLAHANPSLRADILPLLAADPAIRLAGLQVKLAHRPQLEGEGLNSRAVAEDMGAMLYFIDSAKNHSKYYEMIIKPEGGGFILKKRWGALTDKVGEARGDEKVEMFMDLRGAQAALAKTYREKTGKGYKDAFNRKMHVSPVDGKPLVIGQYPVGLTRTVGFGWGTQSATKCIPSLRDLQEKIEGALATLSEDSDLTDILADLQAADRIIGGLMRNPEAVDSKTNRSMGDILAKALATPMSRIQELQGMARSSPGRAPMLDREKLRKELVAIKNYIRKQLAYCA